MMLWLSFAQNTTEQRYRRIIFFAIYNALFRRRLLGRVNAEVQEGLSDTASRQLSYKLGDIFIINRLLQKHRSLLSKAYPGNQSNYQERSNSIGQ